MDQTKQTEAERVGTDGPDKANRLRGLGQMDQTKQTEAKRVGTDGPDKAN